MMSRTEGRDQFGFSSRSKLLGPGIWLSWIEKVEGVLGGWEFEVVENQSPNLLEARTLRVTGNNLLWFVEKHWPPQNAKSIVSGDELSCPFVWYQDHHNPMIHDGGGSQMHLQDLILDQQPGGLEECNHKTQSQRNVNRGQEWARRIRNRRKWKKQTHCNFFTQNKTWKLIFQNL